jgi:hypothetical protein
VQNVEDKKLERTESAGKDYYEEFEDTKGAIRIVYRRRTYNNAATPY